MDIEIITTKKKISKSIIKQLDPATLGDMQHFNSMPNTGFYVRDLGPKYSPVVLLFEGIIGWKIIECRSWKSSASRSAVEASCKEIGKRGCSVNQFSSIEIRDIWLTEYNKLKDSCLKNHLII